MSGRIRTIKPELLEDERTAGLSHEAWRLFVSLILMSDDHGRFRAAPRFIEGQVFWARDTLANVSLLLRELLDAGLLRLYTVRGQEYGCLTGWSKHQRVDKPSKPRCPGPEEAENAEENEDSRDPRETLASDSGDARDNLAPDPDPDPDPEVDPREAPAAAATEPDLPPTSMAAAMKLPLQDRSRWATERRDIADWTRANEWPEVVKAARIVCKALGLRSGRLAQPSRDSGVRAILALFAAGYSLAEFEDAARNMPTDKWLQDHRALDALTPAVMRRVLDADAEKKSDAIVWEGS